jgi:uncharacterized caspase-like protein
VKTALVIGNGDYQNTAQLKNPTNDSQDIKNALESLGFKVFYGENLKKREMRVAEVQRLHSSNCHYRA